MKDLTVTIIDPIGLHARPASFVASEASKYKSEILLTHNKIGRSGNLKSIMNILTLGIKKNDSITIKFNGEDESEALEGVKKSLIDNNIIEG
ncbi:phosphocarrier protein HPr [Mycoplasmopsis maculosa]|uniref:Phosphocarrier protein HPr n=1 Tax=Mycoplasmopsis maculosa TaxID=114885 RepID=A0A449B5B0_9BACT|nr:HPr family phosphocarrier protein [Mycoplasmopsis maculosa]VEU75794.1 phosphocarrier protein HPr [Mycoplasmopsis maculosa]